MNQFSKFCILTITFLLSACSSNNYINSMADYRASLLSSNLPYQYGPLTVTNARADGHVVEITMLFNQSKGPNISPQQLISGATNMYCNNEETRSVIDEGVIYRILMRNERGQLISNTSINKQTCEGIVAQ